MKSNFCNKSCKTGHPSPTYLFNRIRKMFWSTGGVLYQCWGQLYHHETTDTKCTTPPYWKENVTVVKTSGQPRKIPFQAFRLKTYPFQCLKWSVKFVYIWTPKTHISWRQKFAERNPEITISPLTSRHTRPARRQYNVRWRWSALRVSWGCRERHLLVHLSQS